MHSLPQVHPSKSILGTLTWNKQHTAHYNNFLLTYIFQWISCGNASKLWESIINSVHSSSSWLTWMHAHIVLAVAIIFCTYKLLSIILVTVFIKLNWKSKTCFLSLKPFPGLWLSKKNFSQTTLKVLLFFFLHILSV